MTGVPLLFVVMLVAAGSCSFILKRTRVGRTLPAIGSNEPASRMAGFAIDRTRVVAYAIFGLPSIAGVGFAVLLSSASANMSIGFALTIVAVAVAVVRGTGLLGGSGTLLGTVTGGILFAGLNNALNLYNVASYWQYIAAGIVLAIALVVTRRRGSQRGRTTRSVHSRHSRSSS